MAVSRSKLLIGGSVIAGAAAYLAVAAAQSGWVYYLPVDQFMAAGGPRAGRARVCGVAEAIDTQPGEVRFELVGQSARVPVVYRGGTVSQMLKPGAQVVVEGSLDQAGVFIADVLLTKCASKYDSKAETGRPP